MKSRSAFALALSRCRFGLLLAGFFSLGVNLLMLTTSVYMMQVFDRVLGSGSTATLLYLTVLALGALLLLAGLDALRSRGLVRVGAWFERRLAPEALERSLDAALARRPEGADAPRDLAGVRAFLASPALSALYDLPWVPVYLGAVYLLHPLLGHIALCGALVLFSLALANDLATGGPLRESLDPARRAAIGLETARRNAEVVDALGIAPDVARRWAENGGRAAALQVRSADRGALVMGASKFARLALQVAVLGAGAWLVLQQELTGGAMIAASIIMGRALAPLEQAIGSWRQAVQASESYKRLKTAFAIPPRRLAAMRLPAPTGRMSVENVVHGVPGRPPVLKGISFQLAPGEALGLVGPSASGKSTLARLLIGVERPAGGVVRLDGADIFVWPRVQLGRHLGYLPQSVELFGGSVAENIARLGEVDPEQVVAAAQLAGCHEMILRLPDGYATEIGEGGAFLSGGQRQRIALARAVYGGPKLVLLDEPNASLDGEGEEALAQAIAALKARGTTVVVIGHRPSTMAQVDRVAVLMDGLISKIGPRQEVLESLVRRQIHAVPAAPAAPAKAAGGYFAAPAASAKAAE